MVMPITTPAITGGKRQRRSIINLLPVCRQNKHPAY
jgi:hypothetical protein